MPHEMSTVYTYTLDSSHYSSSGPDLNNLDSAPVTRRNYWK